jgi:Mrp family chromosome partitioning ATPase
VAPPSFEEQATSVAPPSFEAQARPPSMAPPPPEARPPSPPPEAPAPAPRTSDAPPADLFRDPGETDELGVPRTRVVAEAAQLGEPVDESLVFLTAPYSKLADAYRALRRKLASAGNPRVIGITSAHPGEGKTTFAVNFALALREGARGRVLIVESNHRSPTVSKIFGFTVPKCFLDQLRDNLDDPRAGWLAVEPMAKLHVLAIDPRVKHDPLLDPVAFGAGMDRLKQAGYDFIVVDSPPVIGSVDCNVISDSVEGMIFTALTLKSKRREMRKAVEQLEPAPIFGVVVLEA